MALPLLIRIGQVVYNIAKNPRIAETAKNIGLKFEKVASNYKGKVKTLTEKGFEKLVESKTPSKTSQLGGALRRTKIDKNTPGAEKSTTTVGKLREPARRLGDKAVGVVVGGITIGGAAAALYKNRTTAEKKEIEKKVKAAREQGFSQGVMKANIEMLLKQYEKEKNQESLSKKDPKAMEKAIDKGLKKVLNEEKRGGNKLGMNKGGMVDMRKTGMFYGGGMARKR